MLISFRSGDVILSKGSTKLILHGPCGEIRFLTAVFKVRNSFWPLTHLTNTLYGSISHTNNVKRVIKHLLEALEHFIILDKRAFLYTARCKSFYNKDYTSQEQASAMELLMEHFGPGTDGRGAFMWLNHSYWSVMFEAAGIIPPQEFNLDCYRIWSLNIWDMLKPG